MGKTVSAFLKEELKEAAGPLICKSVPATMQEQKQRYTL